MEKEEKEVLLSKQEIIQHQNMQKDTFKEQLNIKKKQQMHLKATDNDPEKWEKNKLQLLKILKDAPITGVYQNQNQQDFQKFFQFYLNFLNAEIGPRGQCAKKIRKQLLQKREIVDQILKPYNQNHKTHIRSIWVHYKFLTPCKEYHSYKILRQTLQKCQESLAKLNTQNSPMYISIKDGLINKHGQNYDYKAKIQQLKQNYLTKIQKLTKEQVQQKQILNKMQEYIDYVKVGDFMKPYFQEWVQADSGMGKDSVNRGQLFQEKVLRNVLPFIMNCQKYTTLSHIPQEYFSKQNIQDCIQQAKGKAIKRHKIPKLHIMTNLRWIPKSLGEIDIAIVQYDQISKQYTAHVLIECKARLFDIRSASEQVYSQNFQNLNKRELSSKYGKVLLSKNLTSYIITSLPDFEFNLPIQSKLKEALDKITKNLPIQTIKQESIKEKLRQECVLKFSQVKSPLEWFMENNNNKIIVLSSQTEQVKTIQQKQQ